ncbi:MAG: bifunctional oligoribonuclease/PAP phosphatase NrnA [Oscillospiraceae bacterium]
MGTIKDAAAALRLWDNILVMSHTSPDGDTLGSACALLRGLAAMGKRISFLCADKIGKKYAYLFQKLPLEEFEPDKIVTVDVADIQLLGGIASTYENRVDFAIDHHATHVKFAKENWIDSKAAATAQMIYELLLELDVEVDARMASCLYTGLSTDTGCFRYSNANAKAYETAAALIRLGANSAVINQLMFDTKTRACIEVEREVLSNMEFVHGGEIACAYIPRKLLETTGADESDLEGVPSIVRGIEGVLIGITLKEKEDGVWKASVRAVHPVNASEICQGLGGGGHKGAAGCSLGTDFCVAKTTLLSACEAHLSAQGL